VDFFFHSESSGYYIRQEGQRQYEEADEEDKSVLEKGDRG
jgi:hypothetical protein